MPIPMAYEGYLGLPENTLEHSLRIVDAFATPQ
jgi:hypothetical protein